MTALFPTYSSFWQRAKRLLATDLTPIWQRFLDVCDRDSERYQQELESKGMGDFNPLGYPFFY
jgi:hypothetical protein